MSRQTATGDLDDALALETFDGAGRRPVHLYIFGRRREGGR